MDTLRKKFGGMKVNEAERLKSRVAKNARVKNLLVEAILDKEGLKAANPNHVN